MEKKKATGSDVEHVPGRLHVTLKCGVFLSFSAECRQKSKESPAINCGPKLVQHINNQSGLLTSLTLNLRSSVFPLASIIPETPYEIVINAIIYPGKRQAE